MDVYAALDSIIALGGAEAHAARRREMQAAFATRTGAYSHADPWFEARSRAFWDDATTSQGFAREVAGELPGDARAWVPWLERAHRGLFVVERGGAELVLADVWSGAELIVTDLADGAMGALADEEAPFDARVVGSPHAPRLSLLPGAYFHPAEARKAIDGVLAEARARRMSTEDALDALLRMELSLRTLSRVKVGYAYRPEALAKRA